MAWLKNKPAGNEVIGLGDDQIRGNWEYLEDALKREHDFPGTYGSNGNHNKVTLIDQASVPSDPSGNNRIIYTKDGNVYIIDDTGAIIFLLTSTELAALKLVVGWNKAAGTVNTAGIVKMWSEGDNDFYLEISPSEQTESYSLKLPPAQGGANRVLVNDGSGNFSWDVQQKVRLLHVEGQKTTGADGVLYSSPPLWNTRLLNTILTNEIGATLATDQITLPAGTYEIDWSAPASSTTGGHRTRIYDITGGATLVLGSSEKFDTANVIQTTSFGFGRFTLSVESKIELQHWCEVAGRFGLASNIEDHETYAIVKIRKIPT